MAINSSLLCFVCYILHSDWSLLLLVNTHGSFHCKQGMLLVNLESSLHGKQGSLYETSFYNFLWYIHGTESTESTTSCQ